MSAFSIFSLLSILFFIISRPFTVLLHELGHAIPAILMTKQKVTIYIGSYGDPTKSVHFSIGLLEVWAKYNIFLWQRGLCVPSARKISINKQFIYILAGPLTSFAIASFACYYTFAYGLYGLIRLILVIFLVSSIIDLFINLVPRNGLIQNLNDRAYYNDGELLERLLAYPKKYKRAADFYNQQNYTEAARLFNNILNSGVKNETIYSLALHSCMQIKDYDQAKVISDEFIAFGNLNSYDYSNAGLLYFQFDEYDKALALFDQCLELNPKDKYALLNKGFTLSLFDKFEEAILLFDQAIEIDDTYAYLYANRGYAKIKIGKEEEGLDDINHSLKLDENNSYAYRNLGLYHLEKGDNKKALELFEKAQKLDNTTYLIDDLINRAQKHE